MKITQVLSAPPVFRYWNDFGAPKRRRMPFFKNWYNIWRGEIAHKKVDDHTMPIDQLPPGARVMDALDFMQGPIDALPEELIKLKNQNLVFDHPWPFNVELDPRKHRTPEHCYSIYTRFFVPRDDSLVLTNTLLVSDQMKPNPPMEPDEEHLEIARRQYEWSTVGDSIMIRQPKNRIYPKMNINPDRVYGITKERKEQNILNSFADLSQTMLAQHYQKQNDPSQLDKVLLKRSIAFPHCNVPIRRQDSGLNLNLCIDTLTLANQPLPLAEIDAVKTRSIVPTDISPRTWRSLVEKSRKYETNYSFSLPRNSYLHTVQLASRIKRSHRNDDEMLARILVHAYGLTIQYARLKQYEHQMDARSDQSKETTTVMGDTGNVMGVDDKELLDKPVMLQVIGLEMLPVMRFHFVRYQLNSAVLNETNSDRVKNQAWYSGPIQDLNESLRYYLDFYSQ